MGILNWFMRADNEDADELPKKIFISFAIEDKKYRDFLVAQAKNNRSPFSFLDMSVKKKWDEDIWKRKCRKKIKDCDGVIVLLSRKSYHAGGLRWEIKCADQEGIPIIGMHIKSKENERGSIPPELEEYDVISWNWENLKDFLNEI